jgi:hypothetical protein
MTVLHFHSMSMLIHGEKNTCNTGEGISWDQKARRIIRDCLFSIICYAWSLIPDAGDVRCRQLGETSFATNIEYLTFPCFSAHTRLV